MPKFSETMMDHVLSPRNGGVLEQPDLTGHEENQTPIISSVGAKMCMAAKFDDCSNGLSAAVIVV